MNVTTLAPPDRIKVTIRGDVNSAREAVAKWVGFHRPLRDVVPDEHTTHCTVWVEDWDLFHGWCERSLRRPAQPGDLMLWWIPVSE